ncbi:MAG TPA: cbb3-type cytochrome c oxidase subunit II [Candidatus Polarisedimenticolia bacterium]|nr:cbb3-type cytochrome c oxidase subunit II [Candidatus Polarisedimenticolia bacterium]
MKYGPYVFLAAFFALALSWCGFVVTPQVQLGRAVQETNSVEKAELYPQERSGQARQGLEVYRANGCAYCHSQQVGQQGTLVNVVLKDAGKKTMDVAKVLNDEKLGTFSGPSVAAGLPKTLLQKVSMEQAVALQSLLKNAGATTELHLVPFGPDIERGWGKRRTVADDFITDATVMPGTQRVGPDLANVGMRLPDVKWQLMHLYAPGAVVKDSPMPRYQFLFEKRKIGARPSADALALPKEFAPGDGYEVVPKPEARALVEYLLSLRADTPLYEAPLTPPPAPKTNAPAK